MRFVAKHFAAARVLEWRGIAENAELLLFAGCVEQGRIDVATCVGPVAAGQQHTAFLGSDYARRAQQPVFVNDDGLAQKWLDQIGLHGRQATVAQALVTNAWRHTDRFRRRPFTRGGGHAQPRATVQAL